MSHLEHRELLQFFGGLALAADAGGVDEQVGVRVTREQGVHRVAGGAGHFRDHHPLLADNGVDQGGLAHVGPAEKGDAHGVRRQIGVTAVLSQVRQHGLHQGGQAIAVIAGQRPQPVHAQFPEGGEEVVLDLRGVDLVDDEEHLLVGAAQEIDNLDVARGEPLATIHEEEDHLRLLDGNERLLADVAGHRVALLLDAAGVHKQEGVFVPTDPGVVPVAGDARGRVDQGIATPGEAVEQGGFAHVGAADEGHQGGGFVGHNRRSNSRQHWSVRVRRAVNPAAPGEARSAASETRAGRR